MLSQQRDYTEVTYSRKDNLKFGFYQIMDSTDSSMVAVMANRPFVSLKFETF
jgi:hypothetical protein